MKDNKSYITKYIRTVLLVVVVVVVVVVIIINMFP
jgi:hypothetical protein